MSTGFRRFHLALGALALGWAALGTPAGRAIAAEPLPLNWKPVVLPPFLVAEDKPWQYGIVAGHEYLSRCPPSVTQRYAERVSRLNELLAVVLPREFQFESAVPFATILTPSALVSASARDVITGFGNHDDAARKRSDAAGWASGRDVQFFPNLALGDIDTIALFMILDPDQVNPSRVIYTPVHIRLMLSRATPALPRWFSAGFIRLFNEMEFREKDIRVQRLAWTSNEATLGLAADPDYPRRLVPMADFFTEWTARPPGAELPAADVLAAQAALLVRWGLADSRREAFWQFIAAACQHPVDDAMIQRYFGCTMAGLRDQLSDYLPEAVKTEFEIAPPSLTAPPKLVLRLATPLEIGRIIGDWQRLEVRYLRRRESEYVPLYLGMARGTLERAMRQTPTDPELSAILGLLELDAQNPGKARPLLETAAQCRTVRSRAYLELADLRYRDVMAHATAGQPLEPADAASILDPLAVALKQAPAMAEAYALASETWARAKDAIPPAALRTLEAGAEEFPRDQRLLFFLAILELRVGATDKATAFAERGRAVASTDLARAYFEAMLEKLRATPKTSARPPMGVELPRWGDGPALPPAAKAPSK